MKKLLSRLGSMLVEFNAIRDFVDRHSRDEVIEMVISLMPDNQQSRIKDFFGRFPHEDSAVRNTLKLILYLSEVKKIKNIDDKWIDISLKFGIFTNLVTPQVILRSAICDEGSPDNCAEICFEKAVDYVQIAH